MFYCASTDSADSCPQAEPWEQRGLPLCTLASRLQKQKAKLKPHMAACDFIGYFIPPVLCDLHVSIFKVLSLCFTIPFPYPIIRTQPISFSVVLLPATWLAISETLCEHGGAELAFCLQPCSLVFCSSFVQHVLVALQSTEEKPRKESFPSFCPQQCRTLEEHKWKAVARLLGPCLWSCAWEAEGAFVPQKQFDCRGSAMSFPAHL
jgi:hypothetical protein